MSSHSAVGRFHAHADHAFEGGTIEYRHGAEFLVARCDCGEVLDVAKARFRCCPACDEGGEVGRSSCTRCAGTGVVVDHSSLTWRAP